MMGKLQLLCLAMLTALQVHALEMRAVSGLKFPNNFLEGDVPVETTAWSLEGDPVSYPGFSELVPYMLRSPHQEEAGSCLYMSLTGIAEFWLSRMNPAASRAPDGELDLSERYLMNVAGLEEANNGVANWKTDSVYLFNHVRQVPRNLDYRFTKGWVKRNSTGDYVKAQPLTKGAEYNTKYNWINESTLADPLSYVALPRFQRDILFADPASDQWNVGVMPNDIVERIKSALLLRQAPVHVIYNHYGYWHAVSVVGFDENADTKGCNFVTKFMAHTEQRYKDLRAQASRTTDPSERTRLLALATKTERTSQKINRAYADGGGCQQKGMFYVRDSLYSEVGGPVYDYDLGVSGEELPYSRRIVLHEFDWLRYMANHATQIYLE